ncbi:hypothetical protein [Psychrobacillus soli]|uniref:Uncharacterized protein n=1 Tax=Psychrobacillus soli TaxID=1543965 RepID=A0A544TFS9_9BACI|nr:hypothetical protein [Psychrobacillus soli]TQR16280.1 hypothetical protein FG383_07270 [Psychrobacillus soli]
MKRRRSRQQDGNDTSVYVMGAVRQKQKLNQHENKKEKETYQQIGVGKYFRQSSRYILNYRLLGYQFFQPYYDKSYDEINLPPS